MGGRPDFERRAKAVELRRAGLSMSQIARELGLRSNGALVKWLKGVPPPEWTRRPTAKDELRAKAVELRLLGRSYDEIQKDVPVSSSTLSVWLRDVPLTDEQREALNDKRIDGGRRRAAANKARAELVRRRARDEASEQIPELMGNELFIAGLVAYWAEGSKDKPWRRISRVTFINSDPGMIRLFLAWLSLIGIEKDRITYRLSIHKNADVPAATEFWSKLVAVPAYEFRKSTLKKHKPRTLRRNTAEGYYGCLVIVVRRSTDLYCRIDGWFKGVLKSLSQRQNEVAY